MISGVESGEFMLGMFIDRWERLLMRRFTASSLPVCFCSSVAVIWDHACWARSSFRSLCRMLRPIFKPPMRGC